MKKFLAIYLGSENSPNAAKLEALDEQARSKLEQAGMTGWMNWVQTHEKQLVDMGSPVGKTLRVNSDGTTSTVNAITAYTIVQA